MTKGTFGDNLKREREMRGVSLEEISAATRIATRFLLAIENEQWEQLPGGVFNKGFVRAVAHYLGLDEEKIVAEYSLAVNARPSVPVWTGSPPVVRPDRPWISLIFAGIIVIVIIAVCWFGTRRILAWRATKHAAHSASLSASPTTTPNPMPEEPPSGGAANASTTIMPETIPDSTPATATATAGNAVSTPAATTPSVDSAPATSAGNPDSSPTDSPMELKVETVKKTKVTVEADARRVFDGTVKAGDNHTFSAKDRFQISARDAGALVIQLNGKTLAPIGPLGHAGKVTLTREALKGLAGGEN